MRFHAVALGCPAVMDARTAESLAGTITAAVHHDDVVPRASLRNLRAALVAAEGVRSHVTLVVVIQTCRTIAGQIVLAHSNNNNNTNNNNSNNGNNNSHNMNISTTNNNSNNNSNSNKNNNSNNSNSNSSNNSKHSKHNDNNNNNIIDLSLPVR